MTPPSGTDALEVIRELASGYEIFGELGRTGDDDVWFLARHGEGSALVALRLLVTGRDEWDDPIYDFKVARELGSEVSLAQSNCHACGSPLRTFARFCGQCGADQTKGLRTPAPEERHILLAEVRAAAADLYEILGEMPQAEGGGMVYFALERKTRSLVRLRLRERAGGMELGETQVGLGVLGSVTVTPVQPLPPVRRSSGQRAAPLGVTLDPAPAVPAIPDVAAAEPARRAGTPDESSPRERKLTYAVIVLAVVVLVETVLLMIR